MKEIGIGGLFRDIQKNEIVIEASDCIQFKMHETQLTGYNFVLVSNFPLVENPKSKCRSFVPRASKTDYSICGNSQDELNTLTICRSFRAELFV